MRGRVLAVTERSLIIRTEARELEVPLVADIAAGDLVESDECGALQVVVGYRGGDYPRPGAETLRLPRRRLDNLRRRGQMLAALREFFAAREFIEVETPLVVPSPGLEVHLRALQAGDQWLITSPEYQMKRLLAAGLERIFTVCKCARVEEDGPHHASEFTMLEWYRAWSGLDAILADTEALVAAVAMAVRGAPRVVVAGRELDVSPPWPRLSVAEAMERYAGVQVRGDESAATLAAAVTAAGIDTGTAERWDDVFFCAFVERVEPALAALERPLFLVDWPARLAALARRKPGQPAVVERFEAYCGGIELANAFGELTDPIEQRARFGSDQAERRERGLPVYPVDESLLVALEEGLPPCGGIALGVDRLAMMICGADHIRDVQTFASDEL